MTTHQPNDRAASAHSVGHADAEHLLLSVMHDLISHGTLRDVQHDGLAHFAHALRADLATLHLEAPDGRYELAATYGFDAWPHERHWQTPGPGVLERLATGRWWSTSLPSDWDGPRAPDDTLLGMRHLACLPVRRGARVTGYAGFLFRDTRADLDAYGCLASLGSLWGAQIERLRSTDELRASEARFRSMTENGSDVVSILDADGVVRFQSDAARRVLGVTASSSVGHSVFLGVHDDDAEAARVAFQTLLRRPSALGAVTYRHRHASGQWRWLETTGRNLLHDPDVRGIVVHTRDVTERHEHEASLRQHAEHLRLSLGLTQGILNATSEQDLLRGTLRAMRELVQADRASVAHVHWQAECLEYRATDGDPDLGPCEGSHVPFTEPTRTCEELRREPYRLISDLQLQRPCAQHVGALAEAGARCYLGVPLQAEGELFGILMLSSRTANKFTPRDVNLIVESAGQLAVALRHEHLRANLERRVRELTTLHATALTLQASATPEAVADEVVRHMAAHLEYAHASVLRATDDGRLEFVAMHDRRDGSGARHPARALRLPELRATDGITGLAVTTGESVRVGDVTTFPQYVQSAPDVKSEVAVPVWANGRVWGVLNVESTTRHAYTSTNQRFLETLASQMGAALGNTLLVTDLERSRDELRDAYDRTIEGWARALDHRDHETEGHSQRVTNMTMRLAGKVGFPAEQLEHLRRGALLHDIGKLGIPDGVLLKPAPLTEDEWRVMRRHPSIAVDILRPIAFLRPALDIPYAHHERWDGSGYPRGLVGEDIPFAARLFAVVDVWDALTTNRPYRQAWCPEDALAYIERYAGVLFDPRVVRAFGDLTREERLAPS